jgi:hypothetical protein
VGWTEQPTLTDAERRHIQLSWGDEDTKGVVVYLPQKDSLPGDAPPAALALPSPTTTAEITAEEDEEASLRAHVHDLMAKADTLLQQRAEP